MSRPALPGLVGALMLMLCALCHGQGALVTGVVQTAGGLPIPGVDLELSGGITFPVPVVTGPTGVFSFSVVAGTYDVTFIPATTAFAPAQVQDLVVPASGTVNMGVIVLAAGIPLSGTVLDSLGGPVVSGDINVYDQTTGKKLITPGDSTSAVGAFSVIVPAGTYRVRARPAGGVPLVAEQVENVVVAGPTTLPAFVLQPGVVLTGTVVDSSTLAPIADVDLDVDDAGTGARIITPGDNTNGSGVFTVIVPAGTFDVSFEPTAGLTHVARIVSDFVVPSSVTPVSMGSVSLDPGFVLTGTVLGSGGGPVAGADIDVDTVLGDVRIPTPDDDTDAAGQFAVVVPPGTYVLTVEPPFSLGLVGASVSPITVTGNVTVPTINLQPGVALSGTILSWNGLPEVGADVDVIDPVSGVEVVTPNDNTDISGSFTTIVPSGTWDIRIQTAKLSFSRDETVSGFVVGAVPVNMTHQLSLVPVGVYVGPNEQGPVPQGSVVPVTVAWFTPMPFAQSSTVDLVLRNPDGTDTVIVPPIPLVVPPGQLFILPIVPIPLPPINPAHAGLPFQLVLRFRDAATGAEWDGDRSRFVIQ